MKIWVILCLVAGPFVARGQQAGGAVSDGQRTDGPVSGKRPAELFRGWRQPALDPLGPATFWPQVPSAVPFIFRDSYPFAPWTKWWPDDDKKPMTLYQRDSLRILLPDRMPCLVPLRVSDKMNGRKMRLGCPAGVS
jgi:hypothetical protein